MKDIILLTHRGRPLREFPVGAANIRVGRGRDQDIVVHDALVPEKALIISRDGDAVRVRDAQEVGRGDELPVGASVDLGEHRLHRVRADRPVRLHTTEPLGPDDEENTRFAVLVMEDEIRRYRVGARPVIVGSAPDCDVVLRDSAVSAHHCRIESCSQGVVVRDLGSRNGTWVDGKRLLGGAEVTAAAALGIGRKDVRIVPRGRPGDVRGEGRFIAESPSMLAVLSDVERFAALPFPIMILGESGVGKEGLARAVHERGPRADGPFVAFNAAGFTPQLAASELFGHEAGAFTGALRTHRGVFEQAQGGTLFMDEVGELPLELQSRLLRVLDTWRIRPVGSELSRDVDVRLVCATHRDLGAQVSAGTLREDLYYRLQRLVVAVPPLRERPGDIVPLVHHFAAEAASVCGAREFTSGALMRLESCRWQGNVRELRNVVQACMSSPDRRIDEARVSAVLDRLVQRRVVVAPSLGVLTRALARYDGNSARAARSLGMARSTFRDRLKREREVA